ncbi:MAG: hypothetical protein WAV21_01745 [Minisyncoccia bacterium]
MLKGIIIEQSLNDVGILKNLKVLNSLANEGWKFHEIEIEREAAENFSKYLASGPWYIHFWEPGEDDVLVVFKDKIFTIKHSDTSTWKDAVEYGESIGIPKEQLDFLID